MYIWRASTFSRNQFRSDFYQIFPFLSNFVSGALCVIRVTICITIRVTIYLAVKFCNRVKFCELINFELIGNFWVFYLFLTNTARNQKNFWAGAPRSRLKIGLGLPAFIEKLGWDSILFTLFLFNASFTFNLTNHKQNFSFCQIFAEQFFRHFSPFFALFFRFSPIRAFYVFFYVNFYVFF